MANWKDVAAKITELLPAAGATFAGPLGAGAGLAIKAIANAFGIKSADPQPQEVMAAIGADPQAVLKLESARQAYDLEVLKMQFADIKDARARDVAIRQAGQKNTRADLMLLMAFLAVIAIAFFLAMEEVDGATAVGGFLIAIGGMFARNIGTAFDFEFGSSRGSKDKDNVISVLTK